MPKLLSDEEVKEIIEKRILKDSKNKSLFRKCKLKKGKEPEYTLLEPERDSYGHYATCDVEGFVAVGIYKDPWPLPTPGTKRFSAKVSYSDRKLLKMEWYPCERTKRK